MNWFILACTLLVIAAFFIVIRRAANRAERESKERASRKWGKPDPGELETMMKRPPWDGSASGEGKG